VWNSMSVPMAAGARHSPRQAAEKTLPRTAGHSAGWMCAVSLTAGTQLMVANGWRRRTILFNGGALCGVHFRRRSRAGGRVMLAVRERASFFGAARAMGEGATGQGLLHDSLAESAARGRLTWGRLTMRLEGRLRRVAPGRRTDFGAGCGLRDHGVLRLADAGGEFLEAGGARAARG